MRRSTFGIVNLEESRWSKRTDIFHKTGAAILFLDRSTPMMPGKQSTTKLLRLHDVVAFIDQERGLFSGSRPSDRRPLASYRRGRTVVFFQKRQEPIARDAIARYGIVDKLAEHVDARWSFRHPGSFDQINKRGVW